MRETRHSCGWMAAEYREAQIKPINTDGLENAKDLNANSKWGGNFYTAPDYSKDGV